MGEALPADGKHSFKMLPAQVRYLYRQQHRHRHEQYHDQCQPPVLKQHHHSDGDYLQKADHQRVDNAVDGVAHRRDVLGHAVEYLADWSSVHEAYGEPAYLGRELDAQGAGEIAADDVIEQQHFQPAHQALQQVHPRQRKASTREHHGQARAGEAARPVIVQKLDAVAQQLRRGDGAGDYNKAYQTCKRQPFVYRLCLLHQSQQHGAVTAAPLAGGGSVLFVLHFASPPVWEM